MAGFRGPIRGRDPQVAGLRATVPASLARWDRTLVWFMRALALAWLVKGIASWALILGAGHPVPSFEARSTGFQATLIYFAVIDLIAAVGLWLSSTWGGVMWLLAIVSYLILAMLFPAVVASNLLWVALCMGLIVAYLALSWLAAQET